MAVRIVVLVALGLLGLFVQPALARAQPGVTFTAKARDRMVITTPGYRVALAKRNGAILEIFDRAAGVPVTRTSTDACLWVGNAPSVPGPYASACLYGQDGFVYRWSQASSTLTMRWTSTATADHRVDAIVTLTAAGLLTWTCA